MDELRDKMKVTKTHLQEARDWTTQHNIEFAKERRSRHAESGYWKRWTLSERDFVYQNLIDDGKTCRECNWYSTSSHIADLGSCCTKSIQRHKIKSVEMELNPSKIKALERVLHSLRKIRRNRGFD